MAGTNDRERRDDDAEAQAQARAREQENFNRIVARLEALVEQRDPDVKAAMGDQPDTASGEYRAKEQRWNVAANEVRGIIRLMQQSLEEIDDVSPPRSTGSDARPTGDGID